MHAGGNPHQRDGGLDAPLEAKLHGSCPGAVPGQEGDPAALPAVHYIPVPQAGVPAELASVLKSALSPRWKWMLVEAWGWPAILQMALKEQVT